MMPMLMIGHWYQSTYLWVIRTLKYRGIVYASACGSRMPLSFCLYWIQISNIWPSSLLIRKHCHIMSATQMGVQRITEHSKPGSSLLHVYPIHITACFYLWKNRLFPTQFVRSSYNKWFWIWQVHTYLLDQIRVRRFSFKSEIRIFVVCVTFKSIWNKHQVSSTVGIQNDSRRPDQDATTV